MLNTHGHPGQEETDVGWKSSEILKRTVRRPKDRQDVLDCMVRKACGRDRHDTALTSSCYWEDGSDEHEAMIARGPVYGERANTDHAAFFAANCHNLAHFSAVAGFLGVALQDRPVLCSAHRAAAGRCTLVVDHR